MEEQYQGFVSTNDNNNKRAAEEAKDLYKNIMLEIFSGGEFEFHKYINILLK